MGPQTFSSRTNRTCCSNHTTGGLPFVAFPQRGANARKLRGILFSLRTNRSSAVLSTNKTNCHDSLDRTLAQGLTRLVTRFVKEKVGTLW